MANKTLREVAEEAIGIYAARGEAAGFDAGFDAGEMSGPAHARAAEREVRRLAEAKGFTLDQVLAAVDALGNE
jgi:hypothetical protein